MKRRLLPNTISRFFGGRSYDICCELCPQKVNRVIVLCLDTVPIHLYTKWLLYGSQRRSKTNAFYSHNENVQYFYICEDCAESLCNTYPVTGK